MGGGRARPARWMRTHRLENALEPLLRQVVEEQGHARLDILHERPRLLGQAKETIPHALVVGVPAASENRGRWGGGQRETRLGVDSIPIVGSKGSDGVIPPRAPQRDAPIGRRRSTDRARGWIQAASNRGEVPESVFLLDGGFAVSRKRALTCR